MIQKWSEGRSQRPADQKLVLQMDNLDSEPILHFGSSSERKDELAEYFENIVLVHVDFWPDRPIAAKLIGLSEKFITLQRRDGRTLKVKRKAIRGIEPLKENDTGV